MSFITREEATAEILRLINAQSASLNALQQEARTLVDGLASQADTALRQERAEAATEFGQLREHTQGAVRTVESKWDEIQALINGHDTAIQAQVDKMVGIQSDLRSFADGVHSSITQTQAAVKMMHANVESLTSGARASGGGPPTFQVGMNTIVLYLTLAIIKLRRGPPRSLSRHSTAIDPTPHPKFGTFFKNVKS